MSSEGQYKVFFKPLLGTLFKVGPHRVDGRFCWSARLVSRPSRFQTIERLGHLTLGPLGLVHVSSLYKTFLTQPMASRMLLEVWIDTSEGNNGGEYGRQVSTSIQNPEGLTVGDLVDSVDRHGAGRTCRMFIRMISFHDFRRDSTE